MKKIIYSISGIVLVVIVAYIGFVISIDRAAEKAYAESIKIIAVIEDYYRKHGKYPEELTKELESHHLSQTVRYGLVKVKIIVQFHNDSFEVYYHQTPLGPFYGYNSQTKEWAAFE